MTTSQIFALISNSLALILTLGMVQWLVLRRGWQYSTGHALLQFLGSLAVLQTIRLVMLVSVLVEYPALIMQGTANLTLMSMFLVALTGLALLLHAGNAMKSAWQVTSRAGVTGLMILLPGVWYYDLLRFPDPITDTVLGHPYTNLGGVIAGLCAAYLVLTLGVVWRFWRQIHAPMLTGSVMIVVLAQLIELGITPLRDLGLAGAVGGITSLALGYSFMQQWEADPQTSQALWLNIARPIADILTINQPLHDTLAHLAEQIRRLVRSDAVMVLISVGTERLEVVAFADREQETANTPDPLNSIVGRQIRQGEGLAGRVMQTLYPMRVDNYHTWNGRAADFEDLPIFASMSVPLLFDGRLVGVVNASQTSPGRTFTDRDQRLLELLASHMSIMIEINQLGRDLHATRAYLQTILEHTTLALLIFDAAGILREANPIAQNYLQVWFGDHIPSAVEFAAQAEDACLTKALVQWMVNPATMQTLEIAYPSLGRLHIELQPIPNDRIGPPDLLVVIRTMSELSPE